MGVASTLFIILLASFAVPGEAARTVQCDNQLLDLPPIAGSEKGNRRTMARRKDHRIRAEYVMPKSELVLFGDSIIEDLQEMDEALATYREEIRTTAFGISGDETGQLLYRIQNGEFPPGSSPQFAVIMIGVNNILHAVEGIEREMEDGEKVTYLPGDKRKELASIIARDVVQMAAHIQRQSCRTQVIIQAILPTAWKIDNKWPNRYAGPIEEANAQIERVLKTYDNVHFLDCSRDFLQPGPNEDEQRIDRSLMEDLLHPTETGHASLGKCVLKKAKKIAEEVQARGVQRSFSEYWACTAECGGGMQYRRQLHCSVQSDFLLGMTRASQWDYYDRICRSQPNKSDLQRSCNTHACESNERQDTNESMHNRSDAPADINEHGISALPVGDSSNAFWQNAPGYRDVKWASDGSPYYLGDTELPAPEHIPQADTPLSLAPQDLLPPFYEQGRLMDSYYDQSGGDNLTKSKAGTSYLPQVGLDDDSVGGLADDAQAIIKDATMEKAANDSHRVYTDGNYSKSSPDVETKIPESSLQVDTENHRNGNAQDSPQSMLMLCLAIGCVAGVFFFIFGTAGLIYMKIVRRSPDELNSGPDGSNTEGGSNSSRTIFCAGKCRSHVFSSQSSATMSARNISFGDFSGAEIGSMKSGTNADILPSSRVARLHDGSAYPRRPSWQPDDSTGPTIIGSGVVPSSENHHPSSSPSTRSQHVRMSWKIKKAPDMDPRHANPIPCGHDDETTRQGARMQYREPRPYSYPIVPMIPSQATSAPTESHQPSPSQATSSPTESHQPSPIGSRPSQLRTFGGRLEPKDSYSSTAV